MEDNSDSIGTPMHTIPAQESAADEIQNSHIEQQADSGQHGYGWGIRLSSFLFILLSLYYLVWAIRSLAQIVRTNRMIYASGERVVDYIDVFPFSIYVPILATLLFVTFLYLALKVRTLSKNTYIVSWIAFVILPFLYGLLKVWTGEKTFNQTGEEYHFLSYLIGASMNTVLRISFVFQILLGILFIINRKVFDRDSQKLSKTSIIIFLVVSCLVVGFITLGLLSVIFYPFPSG